MERRVLSVTRIVTSGRRTPGVRAIAPWLPYLAVGVGLLVFHNAWAAVLSYHAAMLAVVLWQKGLSAGLWRPAPSWRRATMAAGVGASAGAFLFFFWPWLGTPASAAAFTRDIGLSLASWPLFAAYFMAANAIIEEVFWRGWLGSERKGLTSNDLLFAGYHLLVLAGRVSAIWLIPALVTLTFAAWFWRQVNHRNGGITYSMLSHAAADAACILVIYSFMVRLPGG